MFQPFRLYSVVSGFLIALLFCLPLAAQSVASSSRHGDQLQFVVALSRHGVRSPLTPAQYSNQYSALPWAKWDVAPGILTPHGYDLMKLFGTWDRARFSGQGLFNAAGCEDASRVTILADTDQRTRETGKALAEGMFPGCPITVYSEPDGTNDPLFRPTEGGAIHPNGALEVAAIAGRLGGDPARLTSAYRAQLETLDHILSGCGHAPANAKRISIFDVPAGLAQGANGGAASLRGPVMTGATLASNLLLEYTQGMSESDAGWNCMDSASLRTITQLSGASWDYGKRTPAVARPYASGLLDSILKTLEQGVTGRPVPGALGKPGDRLVLLIGHDTNIVTVAGALGLDWVEDGNVNDTPPGGALLFEVWRSQSDGPPSIRVVYTAQTLEQMRRAEPLTSSNPPVEAPIFVPGCGDKNMACSWDAFSSTVRQVIDPAAIPAHH